MPHGTRPPPSGFRAPPIHTTYHKTVISCIGPLGDGMACGQNCRRLSAGAGITITEDCCGGCVISATGIPPQAPGACTCLLVSDSARPGIVVTPGQTPGFFTIGLDPLATETPQGAQAKVDALKGELGPCCEKNAADIEFITNRLNAFPPVPAAFLTPEQAQQIAADAVKAALDEHNAKCHTLKIVSEGVTAESGWEVDAQELRTIGGVNTVFIRLNRIGGDLVGEDADFTNSDGKHEEGNIIPDLLIARVPDDWRPPQTYVVLGGNSYGHGSVRVHPNGDVYLLDWATNNVIQNGYLLRIEYEFLKQSPCETPAGA